MMCGDGLGALPTRALLAKNPHSTQNPKTWRTNLGGGPEMLPMPDTWSVANAVRKVEFHYCT